jgi:hypothetical protein
MNIVSWKPAVSCRFGGGSLIEPSIHLNVILRCPHCDQSEKVESRELLIWGSVNTTFAMVVDWQISEFTKPHDCAHCGGMYVPVPRAEEETFSKSVRDLLTDKWLAEKLEGLKRKAGRELKNFAEKSTSAK